MLISVPRSVPRYMHLAFLGISVKREPKNLIMGLIDEGLIK